MNALMTEPSEDQFQEQYATRCVVIPRPQETTLEEVLIAAGDLALIRNQESESDDMFVVRIESGHQEALSRGGLLGKLGQPVAA